MTEALSNYEIHPDSLSRIYDQFCSTILNQCQCTRKRNSSRSRSNHRQKAWWDDELAAARLSLRDACRFWLNNKDNKILKEKYVELQKSFDRLVRKKKRAFRKWQQANLLMKQKKNIKQFWRDIKNLGLQTIGREDHIPFEILREDGSISSEENEVINKWYSCFKSLLNPEQLLSNAPLASVPPLCLNAAELNDPITEQDVLSALKKAPNNKAVGNDCMDPSYLRHEALIPFLLKLFNLCLDKGICPKAWKRSIIIPIPKSGQLDKRNPLSYRGITYRVQF